MNNGATIMIDEITITYVKELIDTKIIECEQAIEEIRNGEKDSYIVKHDIAIQKLKELKKELE